LELITQINYLANEILLEKRLGIAQLVLLLVALGLMFVSRNPQSEALFQKTTSAFKRFRTRDRVLSLSSDWGVFSRNRSNASSSPHLNDGGVDGTPFEDEVVPILHAHSPTSQPFPRKAASGSPSSSASESRNRDTLKSIPTSPIPEKTPFRRPGMVHRSSSQSGTPFALGTNGVFSPRRLAKTAHLHDMTFRKYEPPERRPQTALENMTNRSRRSSHSRLRHRRSTKMTPRSSMHIELPSMNNHLEKPDSVADTSRDVSSKTTRNDHESDGWVDTDDPIESEQTQEIEFPRLSDEKENQVILSSPPTRRRQLSI